VNRAEKIYNAWLNRSTGFKVSLSLSLSLPLWVCVCVCVCVCVSVCRLGLQGMDTDADRHRASVTELCRCSPPTGGMAIHSTCVPVARSRRRSDEDHDKATRLPSSSSSSSSSPSAASTLAAVAVLFIVQKGRIDPGGRVGLNPLKITDISVNWNSN